MAKINVLQPDVFNMISAGEVVEKPASVVKELVENSIDAGATRIDVDVTEGGIRKITVSDNGVGIEREDLRTAFMPHATSKLKEIFDLDTIATLGFRGEALASIASVSETTMISRAKGAETAFAITFSAGKVLAERPDSRAEGTAITVENLFFNTPARLKFLKRPATELGYIRDAVEKIVLANPDLHITLRADGETLLSHEGGGLQDALTSVYPSLDRSRMLAVERVSSAGVKVSGYVSDTDYTSSTRGRQTVIVNGRVVANDTVAAAVDKVYADYLMKRNYPAYVLDIVVPFDEVDVNVHPAKAEVRFRNKNAVFGAVFKAVDEAVKNSLCVGKYGILRRDDASAVAKTVYEQQRFDTAEGYGEQDGGSVANPVVRPSDRAFDLSSFARLSPYGAPRSGARAERAADSAVSAYKEKSHVLPDGADTLVAAASDFSADVPAVPPSENIVSASENEEIRGEDFANSSAPTFRGFDGAVVGQIFDTYIIVERDGVVYVIDQHAAHERVLYDRLIAGMSNEYAQSLLIPHKLKLHGEEEEYFDKIMPALNEMGFDIEKKLGSYFVYAVPEAIVRMDFKKFLGILFEHMLDDGDIQIRQLVKETVCRDACRAAIKGGDALTRRQIEYVLSDLVDGDGNLPSKCPHGRPAVIALTKRDLEKMFKRIVP